MLLDSICNGRLSPGVTDGVIALLHKGGSRSLLNQWRPITLLNTSYKVFAKTLQLRLQSILMEIISPDQFAFLTLRFILNNIFLTQETISIAKKTNQPLVFLKLDFSKAYDRVELDFLFQVLLRMGFPSNFVDMIKLLFRRVQACVSINGRTTRKFKIEQGVKQGCPVASYLFLVIGEILNECIKWEVALDHIRGITFPDTIE
jgi:hypothetical protein